MRKTRRSTTRRRQTKRGGKFQMKVKNNCANSGRNRINAAPGENSLYPEGKDTFCRKKGLCWGGGEDGQPWCFIPNPIKFNVIIKK